MASIDQRLQDPEYKLWVKAGVCLAFEKQGLETFADERSKQVHGYIKTVLNNNTSLNKVCNHAKITFDRTKMKWTLGCCADCEVYIDQLVQLQNHFKFKPGNWKNTDVQLWPHNAWVMIKVYMNEGQKAFQNTPQDTDLSGMLNFIEHCSIAWVDVQNNQNVSQVREARNCVFHSASMRMTKADFKKHTKAMVELLEDPLFICSEADAKNAAMAIKEVQKADFQISKDCEFKVLLEKIEGLRKEHETLQSEVDILKDDVSTEKETLSVFSEKEEQREVDIESLKTKINQKEDQVKELSTELVLVKKLVYQDQELCEKMAFRVDTVERSVAKSDIEIKDMQLTCKSLMQQVAKIKSEMGNYRNITSQENNYWKVQTLKQRNEELERDVKEQKLSLERDRLTATVKENVLRRKIKELESENEHLKRVNQSKNDRNTISSNDVYETLESDDEQLDQHEQNTQDENFQAVNCELRYHKLRNEALEYENTDLKKKLTELKSYQKQQELEKELQDLKNRNSILEARVQISCSTEEKLKKEIEQRNAKLLAEKSKISGIQEQLDNFMNSAETAEVERKEEQKQYKDNMFSLKYKIQFLEDDNADTEKMLRESKEENRILHAQVKQLTHDNEKKQKENYSLKTMNDKVIEESTRLNIEVGELRYNLEDCNRTLKIKTDSTESLENQVEQAQFQIERIAKEREDETKDHHNKVAALEERVKKYESGQMKAEQSLTDTKNELEILQCKLQQLTSDRQRKHNEIQTLKDNNSSLQTDLDRSSIEVKKFTEVIENLTYNLNVEKSKTESLLNQVEHFRLEAERHTVSRKSELKEKKSLVSCSGENAEKENKKNEKGFRNIKQESEFRIEEAICDITKQKQTKIEFPSNVQTDEKEGVTQNRPKDLSPLIGKRHSLRSPDSANEPTLFAAAETPKFVRANTSESNNEAVATCQISPSTDRTQGKRSSFRRNYSSNRKAKFDSKGLLDLKIASKREFDVQLRNDEASPWVSGCVFLEDGGLVLCDSRNNKIKLFKSTFDFKESLSLKAQPWDVSVVDSNTVIVTLLNLQRLQYIQVLPELQIKDYIKLSMMCWGVEVVNNEIFVTCINENGGEVRVLDMEGILRRCIGMNIDTQDTLRFEGPYALTVSAASGNIFVSDYSTSTVTCLSGDGQIIYQYSDSLLNGARGVIVDGADNIMVCSARSNNVQVITEDGCRHRTLLPSSHGIMKPWCVAHRRTDNTLVLGCAGKYLLVFELEYGLRRTESTEHSL